MESLFDEIFSIDGVHGILIISNEGKFEFNKFTSPLLEKMNGKNVKGFIEENISKEYLMETFEKNNESLMVFGHKRAYIKKIDSGYLFIFMDMFVPIAMVRLNCQLIIPKIDKLKSSKGLGRFFRK